MLLSGTRRLLAAGGCVGGARPLSHPAAAWRLAGARAGFRARAFVAAAAAEGDDDEEDDEDAGVPGAWCGRAGGVRSPHIPSSPPSAALPLTAAQSIAGSCG